MLTGTEGKQGKYKIWSLNTEGNWPFEPVPKDTEVGYSQVLVVDCHSKRHVSIKCGGTSIATSLRWSPDGTWIAFCDDYNHHFDGPSGEAMNIVNVLKRTWKSFPRKDSHVLWGDFIDDSWLAYSYFVEHSPDSGYLVARVNGATPRIELFPSKDIEVDWTAVDGPHAFLICATYGHRLAVWRGNALGRPRLTKRILDVPISDYKIRTAYSSQRHWLWIADSKRPLARAYALSTTP